MRLVDADVLTATLLNKGFLPVIVRRAIHNSIVAKPTGEWSIAIGYDPNKKFSCSSCQKMSYEPTSYCPHCGAEMEVEHDA